jgi:hypothetical protein
MRGTLCNFPTTNRRVYRAVARDQRVNGSMQFRDQVSRLPAVAASLPVKLAGLAAGAVAGEWMLAYFGGMLAIAIGNLAGFFAFAAGLAVAERRKRAAIPAAGHSREPAPPPARVSRR